ncbi:hypothetical protein [Bradyrhizobium pachyrhizi]|uniref:hypothetical protein n=1 Tax=Bradyrhizobium pachyrhizi TaxID=280333 RepID=UPI000AE373A5|nr:hypothetical protein [Bradyrhizobium pachyrhizi]
MSKRRLAAIRPTKIVGNAVKYLALGCIGLAFFPFWLIAVIISAALYFSTRDESVRAA